VIHVMKSWSDGVVLAEKEEEEEREPREEGGEKGKGAGQMRGSKTRAGGRSVNQEKNARSVGSYQRGKRKR